ncbi:TatD family hydrolase [Cetobacterium sp. SF1]|uniref:TatD family hydrolase n=1 Tax=Cetobacterium sp. SF1 TaxID=3417654 RepID=UPI003CF4A028
MYYDTHCHIDLLKNRNEIIKEIEANKIYTIAMTNLPILFEKLQKEISSKYIKIALGFHPELIYNYRHLIPKMWDCIDKTKYIGEIGLDFNKNISREDKEIQFNFIKELLYKCHLSGNKILSLHSRGAEKELNFLIKNTFNGVLIFHWYTGEIRILKDLIKKECYFSINHSMIKTKSGQRIIQYLPLNKILLETDYPFIKNINSISKKEILHEIIMGISKIKNIEVQKIENILFDNFKFIINKTNT